MRRIVCHGPRLPWVQTQYDTFSDQRRRFDAKEEIRRYLGSDRESGRISACLYPDGPRAESDRWLNQFPCRAERVRSERGLARFLLRLHWLHDKRHSLRCISACRVARSPAVGLEARPAKAAAWHLEHLQRSCVASWGWEDRPDSERQRLKRESNTKLHAKDGGRAGKYARVRDHSQINSPCEFAKKLPSSRV